MSRRGSKKSSKFDINPLIGVVMALGLIGAGHVLEGGRMGSLAQFAAGLIVFGGTLGAVLISFSFADLRHAIGALRHMFIDQAKNPEDVIAAIGRFAVKARKEGIMKLEDDVDQTDDPFLQRGLSLAVDGATPTTIRTMLEGESMSRYDAEEAPARVYESAGGYAPTVGILGAVLGLINVMENLSDPTKLGSGIAVAFVATVYGVGSANLIFLPIATKLRTIAAREARRREVIIEGILAIQEGLNPRLIDQKLRGLFAIEDSSTTRRLRGRAA